MIAIARFCCILSIEGNLYIVSLYSPNGKQITIRHYTAKTIEEAMQLFLLDYDL